MFNKNPHIYLISDSTGETVSIVARSVYARFENIDFNESRWALIRSNKQIDNIIKIVEEKPSMILYTMINKKLEEYLLHKCIEINIKAHPILDSTITALKEGFELKTKNQQISRVARSWRLCLKQNFKTESFRRVSESENGKNH